MLGMYSMAWIIATGERQRPNKALIMPNIRAGTRLTPLMRKGTIDSGTSAPAIKELSSGVLFFLLSLRTRLRLFLLLLFAEFLKPLCQFL
jgi:hypothetical protein